MKFVKAGVKSTAHLQQVLVDEGVDIGKLLALGPVTGPLVTTEDVTVDGIAGSLLSTSVVPGKITFGELKNQLAVAKVSMDSLETPLASLIQWLADAKDSLSDIIDQKHYIDDLPVLKQNLHQLQVEANLPKPSGQVLGPSSVDGVMLKPNIIHQGHMTADIQGLLMWLSSHKPALSQISIQSATILHTVEEHLNMKAETQKVPELTFFDDDHETDPSAYKKALACLQTLQKAGLHLKHGNIDFEVNAGDVAEAHVVMDMQIVTSEDKEVVKAFHDWFMGMNKV